MLGNRRRSPLFFADVIDKWLRSQRDAGRAVASLRRMILMEPVLVAPVLVSRRGNLSQRVLLPRTFLRRGRIRAFRVHVNGAGRNSRQALEARRVFSVPLPENKVPN